MGFPILVYDSLPVDGGCSEVPPLLKHDEYVEMLHQRLKGRYQNIYRGLPLRSERGRLVGEIDLVAVSPGIIDVFEVKCSFRPAKARKQLSKIRKLLGNDIDTVVNTWFFCGEAEQLVRV